MHEKGPKRRIRRSNPQHLSLPEPYHLHCSSRTEHLSSQASISPPLPNPPPQTSPQTTANTLTTTPNPPNQNTPNQIFKTNPNYTLSNIHHSRAQINHAPPLQIHHQDRRDPEHQKQMHETPAH
ncbi:hypothetical protein KC19_4G136300 [Ceratodon purpureus]|uniref:Uncharacterized protein n=1 Tax=Ceratodon purpureus TaxID=3225 RepID=A0A8T0IAF2_CERPU|nr:hypothetical protein KC19_4G136300 [Ceratodon purpureus]